MPSPESWPNRRQSEVFTLIRPYSAYSDIRKVPYATNCFQRGQTIKEPSYQTQLIRLKWAMKEKRPEYGTRAQVNDFSS